MSKKRRYSEFSSDSDYQPEENDKEHLSFLDTCDKQIKDQFLLVQKEIALSEPNIKIILQTPMLAEDKALLFQLFEIYASDLDSISIEKLELRNRIQTKFDQAVAKFAQQERFSKQEFSFYQQELNNLNKYNEIEDLKYDIVRLETGQRNKQIIYNEYRRMLGLPFSDDELPKLKTWLRWALSLPYDKTKQISYSKKKLTKFLQLVSKKMDEKLYGMKKVKEQILLFLNSRILNPTMQKCSLGLVGPPGTGKTAIVRLLAQLLDYPLEQISLGGVRSSDFLKGHQYTYIGSEPGEICRCLRRMGVKNGILFFDEYDKISNNEEICSVLLHITDSSQNDKFQDNYLSSLIMDLSHLWLIYSMNRRPIDKALSDRIFYIEIDGYNQEDKFFILRDYLLPTAHRNVGWKLNSLTLTDEAIRYLIEKLSPSTIPGIRDLDHAITSIVNKVNFLYHHQTGFKITFDIGKKLIFPFQLEKDQIDLFLN